MDKLIDIHCHILPGLDDGAQTLEEALAMAELAVRENIGLIIATPHYGNAGVWVEADTIHKAVAAFNAVLEQHHLPLRILAGQEIRLTDRLLEQWEAGHLLPLAGAPYVLIELPSSHVPKQTEPLLHELRVLGYTPIIAHPERNKELAEDPDRLRQLITQGALSQVTAGSLTGRFGPKIAKTSLQLCQQGLAHFIASDAHNSVERPFAMDEAFTLLTRTLGEPTVERYRHHSRLLFEKQLIDPPEPTKTHNKWYRFW